MRLVGRRLFAHYDLRTALEQTFDRFARDACFDTILTRDRPTRLVLRQAITAAADRIVPVSLRSVETSDPVETNLPGNMVASCTIAFHGLPELFSCAVICSPALRPATGVVKAGTLTLEVEGPAYTSYLANPLLAAELALIEQYLAAQRDVIERWQSANVARVRATAEVVHDQLDRTALRRVMRKFGAPQRREIERVQLWQALPLDRV